MRTVCLIIFTLLCGAVSHLILDPQGMPQGLSLLSELYIGGADNKPKRLAAAYIGGEDNRPK
jgi:hypothetical protein